MPTIPLPCWRKRRGWCGVAGPTLRAMDWVGNRGHGVRLPYNYLDRPEWLAAASRAGLKVESWTDRLGLYAAPLSWAFERRLHFVALFGRASHSDSVR
jgi:hypothetical protein